MVYATGELVYTVEDAVETMGFGFFQVLVTVFSGLIWVCTSTLGGHQVVARWTQPCSWRKYNIERETMADFLILSAL